MSDDNYDEAAMALLDFTVRPRIVRNSVRCLRCNTEIESIHQHDFRECPCSAVAVDGGHSYQRVIGDPKDWVSTSVLHGS